MHSAASSLQPIEPSDSIHKQALDSHLLVVSKQQTIRSNHTDSRHGQTILNNQQSAVSRQQTADSRQQSADSRQQTANSRQQTTDNRQLYTAAVHTAIPVTSTRQPVRSRQPITCNRRASWLSIGSLPCAATCFAASYSRLHTCQQAHSNLLHLICRQ